MQNKILRLPAVQTETGQSRSTVYLRISQGLWPKPVKIGERSIGWPIFEVEAINAARIAGKTDDEIRLLVIKLKTERTNRMEAHDYE